MSTILCSVLVANTRCKPPRMERGQSSQAPVKKSVRKTIPQQEWEESTLELELEADTGRHQQEESEPNTSQQQKETTTRSNKERHSTTTQVNENQGSKRMRQTEDKNRPIKKGRVKQSASRT